MAKQQHPQDDNSTLAKSREIIESYLFSTSEREFSIYSERLMIRMIEIAQCQVLGLDFRSGRNIGQVEIGKLGDARLEIPIKSLLGEGDSNYTQAKNAIKELMLSPYFVERPKMKGGKLVYDKDGNQEFEFFGYQILNDCKVNVKPGYAVIDVNENTWKVFLDFSKGYRRFDLNAAMQLSKTCSTRMFRLISNQKYPITYTIAHLKAMWGLKDKYKDNSDFLRRVIEPAKKELDEKAPWSFTYCKNCTESAPENQGRRGPKTIVSLTFFPYQVFSHTPVANALLRASGNVVNILGRELYDTLMKKFEFTAKGIDNNKLTFITAQEAGMDILDFLDSIAPYALHATNPPGYVINCIDKCLKTKYGVVKTPNGYVVQGNEVDEP